MQRSARHAIVTVPEVSDVEPRRGLVGSFSRRHIDLQRVAGALCPSFDARQVQSFRSWR